VEFVKSSCQTEFASLKERSGLPVGQLAEILGVSYRTIYRWENGDTHPDSYTLTEMGALAGSHFVRESFSHPPLFKFIDLFAGIGGLRRGFEAIGGKCVFTSEWDEACRKTYLANFDCNHPIEGDITAVDPGVIPQHDVLVAGFPCQPFSIAGVSKKNSLGRPHGFHCDTQGTLFFDVARLIEHHRPKAFLLENVKNLISHDKGNTFKVIMRTLREELDYNVKFKVIDGRAWVPQHRERIYIVGFRNDVGFSFDNLILPDPKSGPTLRTILHPQDGSELAEEPYTTGDHARVSPKYTLSDKLWNYLQGYAEKHRAKGNGFGFGLVYPENVTRTLSARYYKDGSEILVAQPGTNPRRLTPRECARLMGFDVPGERSFKIPVSDTQAYKQFGNSVVVPAVEAVARHMLPGILMSINRPDIREYTGPHALSV